MFLVDTSVWIDYFRQQRTMAVSWFEQILERGYPFGLTGVIYQEVLQGADSEASAKRLEEYLTTQDFYHLRDPLRALLLLRISTLAAGARVSRYGARSIV